MGAKPSLKKTRIIDRIGTNSHLMKLSCYPTTDMLIEKRTFQMQQYQYNNTWDMRVYSIRLNVRDFIRTSSDIACKRRRILHKAY